MPSPDITRRWSRHPVDLSVRVVAVSRLPNLAVPGRATEISEGGMALYAGVPLQKGDLMEVEFQTPVATRVEAIVRDRIGFCYGLEFLVPLSAPTASGRAKAAAYSKPAGAPSKTRPTHTRGTGPRRRGSHGTRAPAVGGGRGTAPRRPAQTPAW